MKYAVTAAILIIFFVFIRTAPPTIYMGDSGEIVSAAYTLGIGHPPGYPLYMLCAKIFSYLPAGDIAFRVNIFSALLAAIVYVLLVLASREFIIAAVPALIDKRTRRLASLLASALFIFSGAFWFQGIHAKGGIYVFTFAVIVFSILCGLKYANTKNIRFLYLTLYSAGFMVPAHPSAALFAVFISGLVIFQARGLKPKARHAAAAAGLLLAGFISPYAYLFIRAAEGPLVNWNSLSGFQDVLGHIMRNIYTEAGIAAEPAVLFFRLEKYLSQQAGTYGILLIFFLNGMYLLYKSRIGLFFSLIVFMVLNTAALIFATDTQAGFTRGAGLNMSLYLSRGFFLSNDIVPSLVAALGFYGFFSVFFLKARKLKFLMAPLAGAVFFIFVLLNYPANDLSLKFHAYDHAMNIMKTLRPNDRLFSAGDCPSFNLAYLKFVKNLFPDIRIYGRDKALLDRSIYKGASHAAGAENAVISGNPGRVFYTDKTQLADYGISTVQYGIIYKAVKGAAPQDGSLNLFRLYSIRDYFRAENLDVFYRDYIAKYMTGRAVYAAVNNNTGLSRKYLDMAYEIGGESAATLIDIINTCYSDLKDRQAEIHYLKKLCEMNPYDMETLDVLMNLYVKYDSREALGWIKVYYRGIPEIKGKPEIKKQIDALQGDIDRL